MIFKGVLNHHHRRRLPYIIYHHHRLRHCNNLYSHRHRLALLLTSITFIITTTCYHHTIFSLSSLELDTCWAHDKIQDGGEYLHYLFSSRSFHICAKKPQDKWLDRTFPKPNGKFFMEIIFSSKCSWKRNRFSIVIMNMWDSKWMTYPELSFDIILCHWWTWTEVMYKDGQTFCLDLFISLLRKIGSCSLCIFCVVMQITWVAWKQTVPCIMRILILEVCRFLCRFREKIL